MKLLTRDTDYAIRALCFIAQNKKRLISAGVLVKELKIPRPFLRKILQQLNRAGVLSSYKGKHGGFSLAKSADKIYLIDLIKIFQGPLKLNECRFKKQPCFRRKICTLKRRIDVMEKKLLSGLDDITIKSLLVHGGLDEQ